MNLYTRFFLLPAIGLCFVALPAQAKEMSLNELLTLELEDLSNIKVTTGSKRAENLTEAPSIMSVITHEDIQRYGANNLFEIISRFPSLNLISVPLMPTGMGGDIRGQTTAGTPNHILTLLDGRPMRESQLGGWDQAFYQSFPIETIERVEMIRGPGSVLYGTNAFSGVLNIITKKADQADNQGGYTSVGYGSFHTRTGESSYRMYNDKHDISIAASINYFDSAGWDYPMTDWLGNYDNQKLARDAAGGFIRGQYKNLTVTGFKGQTNTQSQGVVPIWPFGEHKQQREFIDIGYQQPLWGEWNANFNVTYNGFENTATDGSIVADKNNFHDLLYEVSVAGPISDNANIVAGITYDDRRGSLDGGQFDDPIEGLYLQTDYKPVNWLKFIGGFQLNRPENAEVAKISPRLGTIINFTPQIGAKLLYGEAFRSPSGAELSLNIPTVIGDPNLKSETIKTTELQVFYTDHKYYGAVTLYRSDTEDSISTGANPNPGPMFTFQNGGKSKYKGVEFEGKAFVTNNWELQGSFTYQYGKDMSTGNKDITLSPHLMVKAGASYMSDLGYSVGIFNQYVDDVVSYRTTALPTGRSNPTVKSTNLVTANFSAKLNDIIDLPDFMPATTFSLYGDNLLNADINIPNLVGRSTANTIPGHSGRAIYGRLSMRF
jgi:outer membrane receptor for ferrienterochelin and colicin